MGPARAIHPPIDELRDVAEMVGIAGYHSRSLCIAHDNPHVLATLYSFGGGKIQRDADQIAGGLIGQLAWPAVASSWRQGEHTAARGWRGMPQTVNSRALEGERRARPNRRQAPLEEGRLLKHAITNSRSPDNGRVGEATDNASAPRDIILPEQDSVAFGKCHLNRGKATWCVHTPVVP